MGNTKGRIGLNQQLSKDIDNAICCLCKDLNIDIVSLLRVRKTPYTWYRTVLAYIMGIELDMRRVDIGLKIGYLTHGTICVNINYCRERLPYDKDYRAIYEFIKKYFIQIIERKNNGKYE